MGTKYWKERQVLPHGRSGRAREVKQRELKVKPQFTLEDLYIPPFTEERRYDVVTGEVRYQPLERNMSPSGIELLDEYLRTMTSGCSQPINDYCEPKGLRSEDIDSLVFILTGTGARDFRNAYLMRLADDLLRFTDLTIKEVARRAALGTAVNFCFACQRSYGCTPGERRKAIGQKGDVGRFRL